MVRSISTFLFILPIVSTIFLFLDSQGTKVLYGALLIVATIFFFVISLPLERVFAKIFSLKTLSYLMPIYYFLLVIVSITLCWKLINASAEGEVWIFLFAFSCCYLPYNYLLQKEQVETHKISILTNVTNNYAVLGYLLFGIIMNFTNISVIWSYLLLACLAIFLLWKLPSRLQREVNQTL